MQQPILPTRPNDRRPGEAGFTLLEVVCVIAILAILAGMVMPALPHGTSRSRLEGFALDTAALLKADRQSALRRQMQVATDVDAPSRLVRSGATGRTLRVPDDVDFDALLPAHCAHAPSSSMIQFFPSGMSCGGVIKLSRMGFGYEVRVSWFTGGIDIVSVNQS